MTIIFKVKSQEAYVVKILAELLANNIKTGCFSIDSDGISLVQMDHHRRVLINLKMESKKFPTYKFSSKKMFLGIHLSHLHKILKSVKKKDSIELFIDDETPTDLNIKVIPKENNRITTSTIKIQPSQNIDTDIPSGYTKSIIVSSSEFQKMIKDMGNIGGNIIKVSSKYSCIEFDCNTGGILKRKVKFGEEDTDEQNENYKETEFIQEYDTDQLCRITKLSGLSSNIQIYPGKPLLFESNIGTIGNISIYIKSKEQIKAEEQSKIEESDEYESD